MLLIKILLALSLAANVALVLRLLQQKKTPQDSVTEEEIRMMVDAGGDSGSIDANEHEMINNIFELDDTSVGDIATHRTDIVAVSRDATLEDIWQVIMDEKYSRIPVYDENIDNIIGIFHVKDLVKYLLEANEKRERVQFSIEDIMMKPYFVPFSKKTDELFREMQIEKIHLAIVIDEYGGTAGLVTVEDIVEEIVGNIFDEYDQEEEEDIAQVSEGRFQISGTADLADVEEELGITLEDAEDYETLGGFLIGKLGRIPEENDEIEIREQGYLFHAVGTDEKRIDKVTVTKLPDEKEKTEGE